MCFYVDKKVLSPIASIYGVFFLMSSNAKVQAVKDILFYLVSFRMGISYLL